MGFFSVYCGFMYFYFFLSLENRYNDFASMGLNLFQTCYDTEGEQKKNCVYLFGIDPIWHNVNYLNLGRKRAPIHEQLQNENGCDNRFSPNEFRFVPF
jgi:hypothetical protein